MSKKPESGLFLWNPFHTHECADTQQCVLRTTTQQSTYFLQMLFWKDMLNRQSQYNEHFVNRDQEERQLVWEKAAGSDTRTLECKVTSGKSGTFLTRIRPLFIISVVCMRLCNSGEWSESAYKTSFGRHYSIKTDNKAAGRVTSD